MCWWDTCVEDGGNGWEGMRLRCGIHILRENHVP